MVDRLKYIFVWDIINHTGARIVLWSWTRHLTLITVPLTAQVYTEMATGEFYAGGSKNIPSRFILQKPG